MGSGREGSTKHQQQVPCRTCPSLGECRVGSPALPGEHLSQQEEMHLPTHALQQEQPFSRASVALVIACLVLPGNGARRICVWVCEVELKFKHLFQISSILSLFLFQVDDLRHFDKKALWPWGPKLGSGDIFNHVHFLSIQQPAPQKSHSVWIRPSSRTHLVC